jgi:hypothetical protein
MASNQFEARGHVLYRLRTHARPDTQTPAQKFIQQFRFLFSIASGDPSARKFLVQYFWFDQIIYNKPDANQMDSDYLEAEIKVVARQDGGVAESFSIPDRPGTLAQVIPAGRPHKTDFFAVEDPQELGLTWIRLEIDIGGRKRALRFPPMTFIDYAQPRLAGSVVLAGTPMQTNNPWSQPPVDPWGAKDRAGVGNLRRAIRKVITMQQLR